MTDAADRGSRRARWRGLVWLVGRRVAARAGTESRQTVLTVTGIALPIALMVIVTSVSVGLATGTTVRGPGVDYWIVPESGSAESAVVSVSGPQFGRVHAASDRIGALDGVDYATPVLVELVRLRGGGRGEDDGRGEYVLAIGVIPRATPDRFAGASTAGLAPGDPYYANATYDGRWTGEVALSAAAADLLGVSTGDGLGIEGAEGRTGNRTLHVANVTPGTAAAGGLPVALVHLSELQALTGAADGDRADQLLVKTDRPGVRDDLAAVYPRSTVLSRAGLTSREVFDAELPLAMSVAALVVAVAVGLLFAASTMGLAVAADSRTRAVLAALGFSRRSRAWLIAGEAIVVAVLGGVAGVGLGVLGIRATNALVTRYVADVHVARFHPGLVGYGIGVAALIGLLTVPYLLVMSRRTTTMRDLQE